MWVRGLKLIYALGLIATYLSHPMWVRGLKPIALSWYCFFTVAPHVGAWIETSAHLPS